MTAPYNYMFRLEIHSEIIMIISNKVKFEFNTSNSNNLKKGHKQYNCYIHVTVIVRLENINPSTDNT